MRVDIFRRAESGNRFSFLIVPEGRLIPAEVSNIDWNIHQRGVALDIEAHILDEYAISFPAKQIQEKGYAISSATRAPELGEHINPG
ncbi:MAG: DUF6139 family protein [Burkholderiaceae bacterium]|jgi:hypothetical protein|nr:DUF6139 family protein [Burkholderiaceae bacterium]